MNDENKNVYAPTEVRVEDVRADTDFELATRLSRLAAVLIDSAPYFIVAMIAGFFGAFSGGLEDDVAMTTGMVGLWIFAGLAFLVLLVINCVLLHQNGQTIGKKLMGIKVVRSDGDRIGLGRIFLLRYLPVALLGMIPFIGYIVSLVDSLMIFRDSRKCLHDEIADTIVILA